MKNDSYVAYDLDGTIAQYNGWKSHTDIGDPIQPILSRLKQDLEEGKEVRIFTARVYPLNMCVNPGMDLTHLLALSDDAAYIQAIEAVLAIRKWCVLHIGKVIPITNVKDPKMVLLYDDRCLQVVPNTGEIVK